MVAFMILRANVELRKRGEPLIDMVKMIDDEKVRARHSNLSMFGWKVGNLSRMLDGATRYWIREMGRRVTSGAYSYADNILATLIFRGTFNNAAMASKAFALAKDDFRCDSFDPLEFTKVVCSMKFPPPSPAETEAPDLGNSPTKKKKTQKQEKKQNMRKEISVRGESFAVVWSHLHGSGMKPILDAVVYDCAAKNMAVLVNVLMEAKQNIGYFPVFQWLQKWNSECCHGYFPIFLLFQIAADLPYVDGDFYDRNLDHIGSGAVLGVSLALGKPISPNIQDLTTAIHELVDILNADKRVRHIFLRLCPVFPPGTTIETLLDFQTVEHTLCEFRKFTLNLSAGKLFTLLGEYKGKGPDEFRMSSRDFKSYTNLVDAAKTASEVKECADVLVRLFGFVRLCID
uniref:Uncharacterized protein n=1 Tax=Octactis speculum TaxID=3111310 RepID=A0A7S2E1L2_9STRA|mmetsp:Transcript_57047/g.77826  ORF Transcript_57047/g.77826 Transcript_57047/m.77826 type:complete len:401 (+) Transcript_57047:405-1607(+)